MTMRELKIGSIYRHFKGDLYLVEDVVTYSETKEKMVLYRGLYGNCERYVRPYDMFLSEVEHEKYPNEKQEHRFEEHHIESVAKNYVK